MRPLLSRDLSARLESPRFSGGRFMLASLPRSTPRPRNSPERGVAATSGRPWFTEARKLRSPRAASKWWLDRKSTRLNSSHGYISYAVFCLKKKKKNDSHNLSVTKLVSHLQSI